MTRQGSERRPVRLDRTEAGRARIRSRLAETPAHETKLRVILVLAHEVLRQRAAAVDVAEAPALAYVPTPPAPEAADEAVDYPSMVARIHEISARIVPAGARVLVVSKGDDVLLEGDFEAAHFPQGLNGVFAGHYPADDAAAIAHLEQCKAGGAEFLIIPATAYWWLGYYRGLAQHLLSTGKVAHHDSNCLILDFRAPRRGEVAS